MVRKDHHTYTKTILSSFKDNPKRFYGYIRNLQIVKCQVTQLEKSDGKSTSNDYEAAELLCKSFEQIFTSEAEFCPSDSDKFLPSSIFSASPFGSNLFDESEVLNKLRMLQSDKTPGPDGIHPHYLKSCAHALAKPLSLIFRCSYDTGALPTDWKLANISPVFKKGSRSDPSNYRPISVTSVPCKIMESILKERIVGFIESSNGFNKFQHGF